MFKKGFLKMMQIFHMNSELRWESNFWHILLNYLLNPEKDSLLLKIKT